MKKFITILCSLLAVALLSFLVGTRVHTAIVERRLEEAIEAAPKPESTLKEEGNRLLAREPGSDLGKQIYAAILENCSLRLRDDFIRTEQTASQQMDAVLVDLEPLTEMTAAEMNVLLAQRVEAAFLSGEVYDDKLNYRPEILDQCFREAVEKSLQKLGDLTVSQTVKLDFIYSDGSWLLTNGEDLEKLVASFLPEDMDFYSQSLFDTVTGAARYVRKIYTIEEGALCGSVPDPACFGSTDDPAVIEALLQTPYARQLIGDQETAWNADIKFLSSVQYYLDESILVLVWQEDVSKTVGTFSEIFLSDGSQLRRRISGDTFEMPGYAFKTVSTFAKQSNAVLALGGDMYYHARRCGIFVYDRDIYRLSPEKTDTCFITADGDMLFSYRDEMNDMEQAKAFVEENDVVFSLVFGPVLIDDGVDVTPNQYWWGEINRNFARSALGMLGKLHYLTMNMNCYNKKNYLPTLRQAADAMVEKGCIKAYTLDGGQTATTVFNGRLINPVQFGEERNVSDIIYFATSVPNTETTEGTE